MKHPLQKILSSRKVSSVIGCMSACSAHPVILEAVLKHAEEHDLPAIIEATANQVDQFGGYTGMTPEAFSSKVSQMASEIGISSENLILGGDHLGPLTWKNEPPESAMQKASDLVSAYVSAGFTKIHIDTSMALFTDDLPLSPELSAERGAILCRAAEEAYLKRLADFPKSPVPVYIIGSEVPVPGGTSCSSCVHVTSVSDFRNTVELFQKKFEKHNLSDAWKRVIAIVVETGVEFSSSSIHHYCRNSFNSLSMSLELYPDLVFEGHSTDYQTCHSLRYMAEDGIAIQKVGPELTFSMREAFLSLENIEKNLFPDKSCSSLFHNMQKLMLEKPLFWKNHYHGAPDEIRRFMIYSYSDRIRYYWNHPKAVSSLKTLEENINSVSIPLPLLSQYLPSQYSKVICGILRPDFQSLVNDRISESLEKYRLALCRQ